MSIERNIVFLYPISAKLKELKEKLEADDSVVVYELDSVNEYGQLIGVVEHSVTFSSDFKKTQQYLNDFKHFVRAKTAKNFLVQDKTMPPHIFSKLQKLGLNEVLKEDSHIKSLTHKVEMFFKPFEDQLKKEEEAKNVALPGSLKSEIGIGADRKTEKDNAVQRVEKMATFEPEESTKRKESGFDADFFLGGSLSSNFELKNNDLKNPLLKSPFDNIQRKKVAQFVDASNRPKLKGSSFKPIVGVLGNNPHKGLDLKPAGELNRKNTKNIDFDPAQLNRKKREFQAQESELSRKKVNFEQVERENSKKRAKFEEQLREIEKKRSSIPDTEEYSKKRKYFDEVLLDLQKKKTKFEEVEKELKKKKKQFEEIEIDLNKKKVQFEETDNSDQKKPLMIEELLDLEKKKSAAFEEVDLESKKKRALLEELAANKKIPELIELDIDLEQKDTGKFTEVETDSNKKAGFSPFESDLDSKKKSFTEVDVEKKRKGRFEEVDINHTKKNLLYEQTEENKKKSQTLELDLGSNNKKLKFDETLSNKKSSFVETAQKDVNDGPKISETSHGSGLKDYEEQTLDYSQFKVKKDYKESELSVDKANELKSQQKLEALLQEDEYVFYDNRSYGLEYLIIYNDFLLNNKMERSHLYKFIHFALLKEYQGVISISVLDSRVENINESEGSCFRHVYCGHDSSKNKLIDSDYERFVISNFDKIISTNIPTWGDETYQVAINDFIYPFYEHGSLLGYAIGHFDRTIMSHHDASKVELLVMSLKGVVLDEYNKVAGN